MSEPEDMQEVQESDETSYNEQPTLFKGAKPTEELGDLDKDEEEEEEESVASDDFIVEDNGPATVLPAAFSMQTHQDLSLHFKTICQFFCHIACTDALSRHTYMEENIRSKSVCVLAPLRQH